MRVLLSALAATLILAAPASAASNDVVISAVYGGGGNAGATLTRDYIELYNRGTAPVDLSGWSVQYASAAGTSWQVTPLTGSIQPGEHHLVGEGAGAGGTTFPTPHDSGGIAMSATSGKVALVTAATALACGADCDQAANVHDFVGYGTANDFETAAAPGLTNATADQRNAARADTDNNAADFTSGAPDPHGQEEPPPPPVRITDTDPDDGAADVPVDSDVTVTFSEAVDDPTFGISCADSGAHTFATSGGPESFTLDPDTDFGAGEQCTVTVQAGDDVDDSFSFITVAPTYRIHDIQGARHVSPLAGKRTSAVPGVVTAVAANGFYIQDPQPDADPSTSEGIFVFTSTRPTVAVGSAVTVSGLISEFRPGGAATNLTTTELERVTVRPGAAGATIAPTVIGTGGRVPPNRVIEDDATGNVETSGLFDPQEDGIDFYESLESMEVQVNDAVAVGPTNGFGEVWVVGDNGANAGRRTPRGGVIVQRNDFNPERIQLDDELAGGTTPAMNVGDRIPGATVGVLSYNFGNFEVLPFKLPVPVAGGIKRETTQAPTKSELAIASFNVENLAPGDPASKYAGLADTLVNNLKAPDVVAVEEIQDNTGATDDGVVDASATWNKLIAAIVAAGGPTYQFRQINPVDDQDGGQPGGNIRQGFLFRTDRGLAFVDRPGGTSTNSTAVVRTKRGPQLTFSPGRIHPEDPAFNASRKPLAGEFTWKGKTVIVVANHFNSKGGDDPLYGPRQPTVRVTEEQRHAQAKIVNAFARDIQRADLLSNYVVLGDLNDFEFSETVEILQGLQMLDLYYLLPPSERYSYVFEGNSQALDHILVSPSLLLPLPEYDSVHVNSEFTPQQSDHDPQVARLRPN
jgi:uncharacterized protein